MNSSFITSRPGLVKIFSMIIMLIVYYVGVQFCGPFVRVDFSSSSMINNTSLTIDESIFP